MNTLGLIGFPLSHSFSPSYFAQKFKDLKITDWQYQLFEIDNIEKLHQLIKETPNLKGLNVTIPYKEKVLNYCTSLTKEGEEIGAVNFIEIKFNEIIGHNTDWLGFTKSLKNWNQQTIKKALILGNGGAAKAIIYSLKTLKIPFDIAVRKANIESNIFAFNSIKENQFQQYDLIINCTPIGTVNFNESILPLPYNAIHQHQFFYDLVYNPTETEMMKLFEEKGATVKNGYEMLQIQADETWALVTR